MAAIPVKAPSRVPFRAATDALGDELWSTDGTASGTILVKDIRPGRKGSGIGVLLPLNGWFYFAAGDGRQGSELWRTDGTAARTSLVKAFGGRAPQFLLSNLTAFDGRLYFDRPGENALELWRADGAVRAFEPVDRPALYEWGTCGTTAVQGALVYGREGYNGNGHSFCRIEAGKPGEKTCFPFVPPGQFFMIDCALVPFGRYAYFHPDNSSLWRTDGTAAGTGLVHGFPEGYAVGAFAVYRDQLYFQAGDLDLTELWKTDGTPAGTVRVAKLADAGVADEPPTPVVYKGLMYFSGYDRDSNALLWRSDGTQAGTAQVKDLLPHDHWARLRRLFVQGDTLFLVVTPERRGDELWKSDGTAAGTVLLKRLADVKAK